MVQKRLISINELADMIGMKPNTIYHWVSQRRVPFVKIGSRTRFDILEIDKWIKELSVDIKDFS